MTAEDDSRLIICEAVYEIRCAACKRRDTFHVSVPIDPMFYFSQPSLRDIVIRDELNPTRAKRHADRGKCPDCEAQDFEIGFVDRVEPYRDGDEMRLPLMESQGG